MSDLSDFTKKNRKFTGTDAIRLPNGTQAERATPTAGEIRYNTDKDHVEYYNGQAWRALADPPGLDSVSPTTVNENFEGDSSNNFTFVLTGSGYATGATVQFIDNNDVSISADTVTIDSSTQITAVINSTTLAAGQEPFDVQVTADSGLTAKLTDQIQINNAVYWVTAAGSLGDVTDSGRTGYSQFVEAIDPESAGVTFTVTGGALPGGASLNSSTGEISGDLTGVESDTTYNFTITAKDPSSNYADRSFSITLIAPLIDTFTSLGGFSYSVPSGTSSVTVMAIAGGGGGGSTIGAGGGAGGMVESSTYPVSPGGSVPGSVGDGGPGAGGRGSRGSTGQNTIFGTITAYGGGGGGSWDSQGGNAGGSGGGGSGGSGGGGSTQTNFPAVGATGFGNSGGSGTGHGGQAGGGGGAGAAGGGGNAGEGRSNDISGTSTTYAGGGGTGGYQRAATPGGAGGGGNGGNPGQQGQANTGGGGGGGIHPPDAAGGKGGSGIVIVRA